MKQNKKPKQTLESAQYGLEINFKTGGWAPVIIEWGWIGYEEFWASRRVLSTAWMNNTLLDQQNSSYPTEAEPKIFPRS